MSRISISLERLADRLRPRLYLWIALMVIAPRLAYVAANPQRNVYGNAPGLLKLADNLATGRGFIGEGDTPDSYFNPGYPVFLAAFRRISPTNLLPIKFAQIALDVGTAFALCCVFSTVCSTLTVLLIAVAIACHPMFIHLGNNVNDEPLLMFLLAASFTAQYRALTKPSYARYAAAGLCVALAAYTKTTPIFLPFAVAGGIWLIGHRLDLGKLRYWFVYLAVFIAALLPWAYRNYVELGQFQFSVRGIGTNLWWGSDPRIFASYGPDQTGAAKQIEKEMAAKGVMPLTENTAFNREQWRLNMAIQAYKDWLHQPCTLMKVLAMKATRTLYASEDRPSVHPLIIALHIPTVALAIYGIVWLWKRPTSKPLALLALVYVGYYYVTVAVGMPMLRYFVPALPVLLALAAVSLTGFITAHRIETSPAQS